MRCKLMTLAVLGLVLAAYPAAAQVSFGIGVGSGYPGDYGSYDYGYLGPLGYPSYVPAPINRSPEVRPDGGVPMILGAVTYIDEGEFRNYRDADGNYLGRVHLSEIRADRW